MRHIKHRRRFKLVLSLLLIACVLLLCEARIEAFAPQIRNIALVKIEETFNDRIKLSIGSIDGGILHPFVLNDIKIKDKKGASLFSSFDINSIRTNYRIWDLVFKRTDNSVISQILAKDSRVYINFVSRNNKVSGFVRLDGDLENSKLKGYVEMPNRDRFDFSGEVKKDHFYLDIRPEKGYLSLDGSIDDAGDIVLNLKATHINVLGADIVCDAVMKNKFISAERASNCLIEGQCETKRLMVNYNPLPDVKASYTIRKGMLEISELNFGNGFQGSGKISLKQPPAADFTVLANNVNLNQLFSQMGMKEASAILTGVMNAKVELKAQGPIIRSTTHLEIRKGTISSLDFDYLSASFKGDGPVIRIEDSKITRSSGYFTIIGEMDLRKIGKSSLFENIKLSSDDRAITWDGWNATQVQDVQEVSMKKKINDDIDLNFKKFIAEEKVDESVRSRDEVQFEYKLHPNNSLTVAIGKDQDFFGFEHKDKF